MTATALVITDAFDDFYRQLINANVAPAAALRRARERYPVLAAAHDLADERRAKILEKEEQGEIVKIFQAFKFDAFNQSQARASRVARGTPDLWVMHQELPIAFWWESKRQVGAKFSDAQLRFRDQAIRCGVGYGSGDRYAARSKIIALGLAVMVGGVLEPVRR